LLTKTLQIYFNLLISIIVNLPPPPLVNQLQFLFHQVWIFFILAADCLHSGIKQIEESGTLEGMLHSEPMDNGVLTNLVKPMEEERPNQNKGGKQKGQANRGERPNARMALQKANWEGNVEAKAMGKPKEGNANNGQKALEN
jgi:hypothetical protein